MKKWEALPSDMQNDEVRKYYDISDDMCFEDYHELFKRGKIADSVIICTQDRMHTEPAKLAIECGYHIMLEK